LFIGKLLRRFAQGILALGDGGSVPRGPRIDGNRVMRFEVQVALDRKAKPAAHGFKFRDQYAAKFG
jgi:hypothetical protein